MSDAKERVLEELSDIKKNLTLHQMTMFQIDRFEKIIEKLDYNSEYCDECRKQMETLESVTMNKLRVLNKVNTKHYQLHIKRIMSHLQTKHNVVVKGHYISICMALGMALGVSIGTASGNLGIGMSIGMCIGMAIGAALDADAGKKGNVI